MKSPIVISILALLGAACAGVPRAEESPAKAEAKPAAAPATAPFARVALALRGCSSCAQCRSTIRQTTKSAAESGKVQVGGDEVEVVFARPQTVPLESVIRRLADSGLHDLTVLDVLFDAEGSVEKTSEGLRFTLRETKQAFPLRISEFQQEPPLGELLRLRSVVQGWNAAGGAITLDLKYVIESLDPAKRAALTATTD